MMKTSGDQVCDWMIQKKLRGNGFLPRTPRKAILKRKTEAGTYSLRSGTQEMGRRRQTRLFWATKPKSVSSEMME